MPRPGRDERQRERQESGARWAAWINNALIFADKRPTDLANASDGRISRSLVSRWTNGEQAASPDFAILAAEILGRDAIDALRAAGHDAIADYAAEMRRDPIGAVIRRELDAIEDDPRLDWLADERKRGTISEGEYQRMRSDFLRRKRESIQLMQLDYDNAVRANGKNPDEPESEENGNRAAL
jgi:transcriptional regulator with XRE-family HTH domain